MQNVYKERRKRRRKRRNWRKRIEKLECTTYKPLKVKTALYNV